MMMRLAGEYLYWRFERVDVHFQSEVLIRPLELAIAAEAGLSREEFVHCTYLELMSWLLGESLALPSRPELKERISNGVDCFVNDGEFSLYTRTSARTSSDPGDAEEVAWPLCGTSACLGSATGTVRLIFSADDIHKLNQGEILITTMTTPDLMLAIEKCAAIVTDEGGLLCHAAIISRELQIPCVIGTGVATKALRDGDQITVNAMTVEGKVYRTEDS
jgi:phosphohistidine swiveling domain-containing protein